jgi:hypothetical protein
LSVGITPKLITKGWLWGSGGGLGMSQIYLVPALYHGSVTKSNKANDVYEKSTASLQSVWGLYCHSLFGELNYDRDGKVTP